MSSSNSASSKRTPTGGAAAGGMMVGPAAAAAPSAAPSSAAGRLRSDYTRPPAAVPGRTPPFRSGKDAAVAAAAAAASPLHAAASGIAAGQQQYDASGLSHTHLNVLYGLEDGGGSGAPSARVSSYDDASGPAAAAAAAAVAAAAPLTAAAGALHRKAGAPCPMLPSHGDLWAAPDQDGDGGGGGGPIALEVCAPAPAAAAPGAPPQSAPLALPAWLRARPFSAALALAPAGAAAAGLAAEAEGELAPDLRALPEAAREAALVDDLLYTFMGVPGRTIRPALVDAGGAHGPALAFAPVTTVDERSAEVVRRLLPLAEYAAVVERFAASRDTPERGAVSEALAAEMRGLLERWRLLVVQLERRALSPGGLSLSELLFQCQAPMASLRLAAEVAAEAASSELTSAGLLNLLARRLAALGGDAAGAALVGRLLAAASEPYFRILSRWLAEGVLDDPYHEFMVREDPYAGAAAAGGNNNGGGNGAAGSGADQSASAGDQHLAHWAARYTLRRDPTYAGPPAAATPGGAFDAGGLDVPQLLWPVRDAVLSAGKYLNAMRECGAPPPPAPLPAGGLKYDAGGAYLTAVAAARDAASAALLRLMRGRGQLAGWLSSLKHFFLLDRGDLVAHLLEGAGDELRKPAAEVSRSRLRGLLEHAARTSSVAGDARLERLRVVFDGRSMAQLAVAAFAPGGAPAAEPARPGLLARSSTAPAWQVLLLNVTVDWPLTLVLNRRALLGYQALFKHLFGLKHAERSLHGVWAALQPTRGLARADQERFRPWHTLVRRLGHALSEYLRYATTDVLEPCWRQMEARALRAAHVDDVAAAHAEFLARAADGALLTQLPVLKCVGELQRVAEELAREAAVLHVRGGGGGGGDAPSGRSSSSRGAAAAGPGGRRGESSFERALAALRAVARDDAAAQAVAELSARCTAQLAELNARLCEHYQRLLAGSSGVTGGVSGGRMSTREELDSLLNLIERLDVTGGGGARGDDGVAAALAGVRFTAV